MTMRTAPVKNPVHLPNGTARAGRAACGAHLSHKRNCCVTFDD
jgi:hypothetical protein